jgi:hypothetical protein
MSDTNQPGGNDLVSVPQRVRSMHTARSASTLPADMRFCLYLIYYMAVCDTALKYVPSDVGMVLRYLPEVALYLFAFRQLLRGGRIRELPIFWPLLLFALSMSISVVLNGSPSLLAAANYYTSVRLTALACIMWRADVTPRRVVQFIDGVLRLTLFELLVGFCELIRGGPAKVFFAPNLDWSGTATTLPLELHDTDAGYLLGTLSNYNHYGMFMCMSALLAMAMYAVRRSRRDLLLACASAVAVLLSFSRHSLIALAVGVTLFLFYRRKRGSLLLCLKWGLLLAAAVCIIVGISKDLRESLQERIATIGQAQVANGDPVFSPSTHYLAKDRSSGLRVRRARLAMNRSGQP